MDASGFGGGRDAGQVDDKVADLTPEDVCGTVGQRTTGLVGSAINDTQAGKVWGGLEDGQVVGVADNVCGIVADDGGGDEVGAGREVDNGVCGARGGAGAWGAAVAVLDGPVDGGRVVDDAIADGAVVLDVAEDLVGGRARVEGRDATLGNGLVPVGGGGGLPLCVPLCVYVGRLGEDGTVGGRGAGGAVQVNIGAEESELLSNKSLDGGDLEVVGKDGRKEKRGEDREPHCEGVWGEGLDGNTLKLPSS